MTLRILFILLIVNIYGCSYVHYVGSENGATEVYGFSVGGSAALEGAEFSASKDGRKLAIKKLNADQVSVLQQMNVLLSQLLQGAVKGAL